MQETRTTRLVQTQQSKQATQRSERRAPRRSYQRPIGVLYKGAYMLVQAHQLSEGGMLITQAATQKAGSETGKQFALMKLHDSILATLVMPNGSHVIVRGELIYETPNVDGSRQYGVKFVELALNQRRAIRIYVAAKTQNEAIQEGSQTLSETLSERPDEARDD